MLYAAVVLFVCTLNLMLVCHEPVFPLSSLHLTLSLCLPLTPPPLPVKVTEITILMQPAFKHIFGWPIRSEFVFGWLGVLIIISGIVNGALDVSSVTDRLRLPQ
jgi:hypothetical protein